MTPVTDPTALGTILGVWAHPDDESYLMAGLMSVAAGRGRRVVCVTATRGEDGSQDHERYPPDRIAEIREAELARSLEILGVKEHRWLDYRDGTCSQVPLEEGVAKVQAVIEEVDPDSVLTFGPDGQTGHTDHVAVSRWTTEAVRRAGNGARLHYATVTPEWAERFIPELEPYNVFAPGTPVITPSTELTIDYVCDDDVLALKLKALEAQVSQTQGLRSAVGDGFWGEGNRRETFRPGD